MKMWRSLFIIMLLLPASQSTDSCLKFQASIVEDLTRQNHTGSFNCSITLPCQNDLLSVSMINIVRSDDSKTGNVAILKDGTTVEGWEKSKAAGSLDKSGTSFLSVTFPLDNIISDMVYVDCILRGLTSRNESVVMAESLKVKTSTCKKENANLALYCERVFTYNGTKYCLSINEVKTATEAINNCTAVGGYLAEIEDMNEYMAIQAEISNSTVNYVLIGGTDEANEGTWIYQHSQTPIRFFDWYPNEPNDASSKEDCLQLRKPFSSQMNDIDCYNSQSYYLCEIMK